MKTFRAKIYKAGINAIIDVPQEITAAMKPEKGYIRVKGTINGSAFTQTLVPVKNEPYRLYVNIPMLKGSKAAVGDTATFALEQDFTPKEEYYPMNEVLLRQLKERSLLKEFEALTPSRKKDILKYLGYIKTATTLQKNIDKVIKQLEAKEKNVRVP